MVDDNFQHPLTTGLPDLAEGFTPLPRAAGGQGLDYIRANLFNRLDMRPLPPTLPGPDNDLSDQLEHFVKRAIQEPDATVYAFGQRWGASHRRGTKSSTSCPDSAFMTFT